MWNSKQICTQKSARKMTWRKKTWFSQWYTTEWFIGITAFLLYSIPKLLHRFDIVVFLHSKTSVPFLNMITSVDFQKLYGKFQENCSLLMYITSLKHCLIQTYPVRVLVPVLQLNSCRNLKGSCTNYLILTLLIYKMVELLSITVSTYVLFSKSFVISF